MISLERRSNLEIEWERIDDGVTEMIVGAFLAPFSSIKRQSWVE